MEFKLQKLDFQGSHFVLFLTILFSLFSRPLTSQAQDQEILVLDHFSTFLRNEFDGEGLGFRSDTTVQIILEITSPEEALDRKGAALAIEYDVSVKNSFMGFASAYPNISLSKFNYLSFWIRGESGGEYLQAQLATPEDTAKVAVWNYLTEGPTTEWSKVTIPFDAFYNLTSLDNITEFVLVFEYFQSDKNGSPFKGKVFVDELVVGTYQPIALRIDHFDDKIKSHALGGNIGDFSQTGDSTLYTGMVNCDGAHHLEPCGFVMDYDNGQDSQFGGQFLILGGGAKGFTPIYQDLSAYNSLHLAVRALSTETNPGNVKVELKAQHRNHSYRVEGITTQWQEADINFSQFTPPLDFSTTSDSVYIGEITFVFALNEQQKTKGTVNIDELEFRTSDYDDPVFPQLARIKVNDMSVNSRIYFGEQSTISIDYANTDGQLESLRLEFRSATQGDWTIVERTYVGDSPGDYSWILEPADLPGNSLLDLRVVAQKYNGLEGSSDIAQVQTGMISSNLFRDSFEFFQILRNENGVYRDAARVDGQHIAPASVATNGIGLISLAIADNMGWIDNAADLAEATLLSMTGQNPAFPEFQPDVNAAGLFRHFIDMDTGERAWESEYSSIDTAILVSGALFVKNYFEGNSRIGELADLLWSSIDWSVTIADPKTGAIFLEFNEDGTGVSESITLPFNEYLIVAWLACVAEEKAGPASQLWNLFYKDPQNLPRSTYDGIEVLTDNPGSFLSDFTIQFAYYLNNYVTTSPSYLQWLDNAMRADMTWWQNETTAAIYEWGLGAGSSPASGGYHADAVNNNPGSVVSPHIIAGYLPIYPEGKDDLDSLFFSQGRGIYGITDTDLKVLWRYSLDDPDWRAQEVQGIDYSTMLFGLASLPENLGKDFFTIYNNFFAVHTSSESLPVEDSIPQQFELGAVYPNPFNDLATIRISVALHLPISLKVYDALGREVDELLNKELSPGTYIINWPADPLPSGVYILQLVAGDFVARRTAVLLK